MYFGVAPSIIRVRSVALVRWPFQSQTPTDRSASIRHEHIMTSATCYANKMNDEHGHDRHAVPQTLTHWATPKTANPIRTHPDTLFLHSTFLLRFFSLHYKMYNCININENVISIQSHWFYLQQFNTFTFMNSFQNHFIIFSNCRFFFLFLFIVSLFR